MATVFLARVAHAQFARLVLVEDPFALLVSVIYFVNSLIAFLEFLVFLGAILAETLCGIVVDRLLGSLLALAFFRL